MNDRHAAAASQSRVQAIIQSVVHRRISGEVLSDDAVLAEFPDLAAILPAELKKLQLIQAAEARADAQQLSETGDFNHSATPSCNRHLQLRCPHCHEPQEVAVDAPLSDLTCRACGSHFSLVNQDNATRAAAALTKLGRFELVERLGAGGFGTVWKARDKQLDRTVAIKVPRRSGMTAEDEEKFFREARAAAQLRHPHIVSVHEVGRDGDSIYIVSDFVQGVNLDDWLTGQTPTSREAAELCAKIADALDHAHQRGVVHRDLKPANIIMDGQGQPHLMDFGLARREMGELTVTVDGQVVGTPAYMSPEQARGEAHQADRRSDVYSLGVVLFQLLTGELPFRGNAQMLMHSVINDEPPRPRDLSANVPSDLETITLKCLEKEPARRYHTALEVGAELRRFMAGDPILSRPIGHMECAWRWCRRNRSLSAAIATTLVLSLAITIASPILALRFANSQIEADESRQKEIALHNRLLLSQEFDKVQMLISDGQFSDADIVIKNLEDWQSRISSRNAVEVLQQLAAWHGSHKRWRDAAEYFRSLLELNLEDLHLDWNSAAMLYVQYAPLVVTLGDLRAYEQMRESAIATYGSHTNASICERILNSCVILPPKPNQLATLKGWSQSASQFEGTGRHAGWNCLAIALLEFRLGNDTEALAWSQRAIDFELSPNCTARAQLVMAMALFRLGRKDESRTILQQSRNTVDAKLRGSFLEATYETGYWHDWLAAGVLLEEATNQLGDTSSGARGD